MLYVRGPRGGAVARIGCARACRSVLLHGKGQTISVRVYFYNNIYLEKYNYKNILKKTYVGIGQEQKYFVGTFSFQLSIY